jgi:hypothetical protein
MTKVVPRVDTGPATGSRHHLGLDTKSNGVHHRAIPQHLPLPRTSSPFDLFALCGLCLTIVRLFVLALQPQPQQRQAHESPVFFYSIIMGAIGPVLAFSVPPIRERLGHRPPEPIPTTYPRASFFLPGFRLKALTFTSFSRFELIVPKRARRPVQGYEDEE